MANLRSGRVIVSETQIAPGVIVNSDINASAGIALSKLATDPLARANHTGSQAASTISDFAARVGDSTSTFTNKTLDADGTGNTISNIANAQIKAAAGIVDSKLATISTAGKVSGAALTSLSSIPSGAGQIPSVNLPGNSKAILSTNFEQTGRYYEGIGVNGSVSYGKMGAVISPSATANGFAQLYINLNNDTRTGAALFAGSPIFCCVIRAEAATGNGSGDAFFGIGFPTVHGTNGITWINNHIGFKAVKVSSTTVNLYATQGDGTTENASASLTTLVNNDILELIAVVNSTTSVDYYWRKNGGALSAATNLTSNLPTADVADLTFETSNKNTAANFSFNIQNMTYQR